MIRTAAITESGQVLTNLTLEDTKRGDIKWSWTDFSNPTQEETEKLGSFFDFHPLAVEDCFDDFLQRPKIDFYGEYQFLVVHALDYVTLEAEEVDIFMGARQAVTYHKKVLPEIERMWESFAASKESLHGPFSIVHWTIDKIVDNFFPILFKIEDCLNSLDDNPGRNSATDLMEELFDIRGDLNKIRKTLIPMRDLLYRITNSERLNQLPDQKLYFHDIYDHLLKLVEMMESFREFSSDIRDSYISMNSYNMNTIMMTLTVITTIFMPLTFIVGIYGMNFDYMPELHWKYGFPLIIGLMIIISTSMFLFFYKKGWITRSQKLIIKYNGRPGRNR
ncbi:magnesium/cobalt transporter CorA [Peribacillus sp. SCS-37]|uniref:magnesium/cobalt transporter CorA n=1 Tax=Paraperibacillus esterisolvens TaxID=3115296 RepID=UPI003905E21F